VISLLCSLLFTGNKINLKHLALPAFNAMQSVGQNIGETQLNMTVTSAGYFSGLFTGMVEGPIQEVATTIGQVVTNSYSQGNDFLSDTRYFLLSFLLRLIFSTTLGNIPGDVWQIVYQTCQIYSAGAALAGFAVAFAVAICNALNLKLATWIFATQKMMKIIKSQLKMYSLMFNDDSWLLSTKLNSPIPQIIIIYLI